MARVVLVGIFEQPQVGAPAAAGVPVVAPRICPVWGWNLAKAAPYRIFALTPEMLGGRRLGFYPLPGVDEHSPEGRAQEVVDTDPGAQSFVTACNHRYWIELLA